MAVDKNTVARWAAALTLGQPKLIADDFNTTKFFTKPPLRIHYAATFNNATASQIHQLTEFNWLCCVQPADLEGIKTGAKLVTLVESHLSDQLRMSRPEAFEKRLKSLSIRAAEEKGDEVRALPLVDEEDR